MKRLVGKELLFPLGLAGGLHLMLFIPNNPPADQQHKPMPTTLETRYMGDSRGAEGDAVRAIHSPVAFSLPSGMGFSRELRYNDVRNITSFSQRQTRSEAFLSPPLPVGYQSPGIDPLDLMISAGRQPLSLPGMAPAATATPAARRVVLSQSLEERLVGSIDLPAPLYQPTEQAWQARATLSVSSQGLVEHVFLDAPLQPVELNTSVLRFLHGLRFKAGAATEGTIELFSPDAVAPTGDLP